MMVHVGSHRAAAGLGAAAMVSALVILPAPAALACSCAQQPVVESLQAGATIAIVTRTDTDVDAAVGEFVLIDSVGPSAAELPARLTAELDDGASCRPYVSPGAIAALSPRREDDGSWTLVGCGYGFEIGDALQAVGGDPATTGSGRPVAYVAGAFGSSRLAALDAQGRVLAWDRTPGSGEQVGLCPGGERLVLSGRGGAGYQKRPLQLTVHDATTLTSSRTVRLPINQHHRVLALRCTNAKATGAELLVSDTDSGGGQLLTIQNDRVERRPIPQLRSGTATETGFVVIAGNPQTSEDAKLLALQGGRTRTISDLGEIGIDNAPAVSPDGRTIAVFGYPKDGEAPNPLSTYDTDTGRRLGSWSTAETYITGMAWTSDGRLLVRHEDDYRESPVRLRSFDRTLRDEEPGPDVPGEWGGQLFTVGSDIVHAGRGKLAVTNPSGATLVADELRLAGATHVLAAGATSFALPTEGTAAPTQVEAGDAAIEEQDDDPAVAPWLIGALVAAMALGTAVTLRGRWS